ncbi:uncharacterized protein LOC123523457 [Mercenaria mercenaria]|uniref:uncharacterized protein LOC123523457 n=1 Tax=Mercenaria mercenaria TaxID=6596 RepID=UPI00234F54BD|nr:uncharacterized protein LOC123523457 [Mercenaria mercenaria]
MTKLTCLAVAVLVVLVTNGYCQDSGDDALQFEMKPQSTFQGCLLRCLDKDLCCSCKESDKLSMNAAMVNDFSKTCASSDVLKCSIEWVNSWMNAELGGASNCTVQDKVEKEVNQCTRKCNGRPWSKPLNLDHPLDHPSQPSELSDLSSYNEPDFTEYCNDIRAGGIFCTSYRKDSFTAGITRCRSGNRCGYHGYSYSWCYVDFSNSWDYCCTGSCGFGSNTNYMWCSSGSTWQYCGKAGRRDVEGRLCLKGFPCGMHQEIGKANYYWCYTDSSRNWGKCCQPWDQCKSKCGKYSACYTGYKKGTNLKKCRDRCAE